MKHGSNRITHLVPKPRLGTQQPKLCFKKFTAAWLQMVQLDSTVFSSGGETRSGASKLVVPSRAWDRVDLHLYPCFFRVSSVAHKSLSKSGGEIRTRRFFPLLDSSAAGQEAVQYQGAQQDDSQQKRPQVVVDPVDLVEPDSEHREGQHADHRPRNPPFPAE